ncbi:TonB-dependent receptor [Erythrobacter sp. SG61-1L]|uniref:TonB-dependent receptor n=1 Tax=Erythrobacter sp. SG61-1L TaxID=1603897 RepID=UPI000A4827D6|nr:TonB-dependent receptor [Erythrobacter sp. SG61-1L]
MAIACSPAHAEGERRRIDLPASTLSHAIALLSREAGISIGTDGTLPHIRTGPVHGSMEPGAALKALLMGTGYHARQVGPTAWRIERDAPASALAPRQSGPKAKPPADGTGTPILVTATKRAARLMDLPMAASVVELGDRAELRPGAAVQTADVAAEVDGMTLTASGHGRNRLFLRGIADSAFNGESQSTVAVILDEARLTYAAPDPDIVLVDMERAEVLKGPQGALHGTGALGGIYHLVTRKADTDTASFSLSGGAEAMSGGDLGYDAAAVVNLPVSPGVAGARLVAYARRDAGWIDTGAREDSNSSQLLGARLALGVEAGGGWRLNLTGFGQWRESRDSQYVYQPGARTRPDQLAEPHDNDLRHVALNIARDGEGARIVLSSAMTWHDVNDVYDATQGAEGFGLADPLRLNLERTYRVWDNEVHASGDMGGIAWLAGISVIEARQYDLTLLTSATGQLSLDDDRRITTDLSAFGDLSVPLGSGLSLDAGARLFRSSLSETRTLPSGVLKSDLGRTGVTPAFALSWRPDGAHLAYLRYGSAIRQGGLDIDGIGEQARLKGDELATVEAGWRQQIGAKGTLDLGAYFTHWQDVQSDMLQPDGLIETANAGNAEIIGFEGSLALPLAGGWQVSAGASYQDARLVRNDLGIDVEDRRLPMAPEYTLRGSLGYSFAIGNAEASLRARLRYVGPARLSFDPAVDRPIGDYLESSLQARLDLGQVGFALDVDNPFGSGADLFAFGNPLRFGSLRQYTPQTPASVTLSAHCRF